MAVSRIIALENNIYENPILRKSYAKETILFIYYFIIQYTYSGLKMWTFMSTSGLFTANLNDIERNEVFAVFFFLLLLISLHKEQIYSGCIEKILFARGEEEFIKMFVH
jgi:hypothetical protein